MTGIQLNGQFLQLAANTVATIRRGNPFLNAEAINGEYSLPVTVVYTESNYQALQGYFSFLTKKQKIRLPAVFFDGTAFSYKGTLVIESLASNMNAPQSGRLTGYFLTGVSAFFSDAKGKLLKDLDWGGVREFDWTTNLGFDGTGGFWQHCHETWSNAAIPYVFYPIRNDGWGGEGGTVDYQNKLDDSLLQPVLHIVDNTYSLCPHLRFVWLLQTMFANYGYTLTGDVLADADFQLLTVPTFKAIDWRSPVFGTFTHIEFDLKDHVPPEWTVTDVMINLWQMMAITFIFDTATRTVKLTALRDIKAGVKKDWTPYCDANFSSQFTSDPHIYSLKNSIESGDSLPGSALDFTGAETLPAVYHRRDLPSADASNIDKYVFVYIENVWLQCRYDGGYDWIPASYNIFSYEQANATDNFETKISTMPVLLTTVAYSSNVYYRLYPACTQEGNWAHKVQPFKPWGMRLLFYRGMAWDLNVSSGFPSTVGRQYPFATCGTHGLAYDYAPMGNWALSYVYSFGGVDKGILATWFAPWLALLTNEEIVPVRLHLPRHVLLDHKADDIILIRNVPFVAENMDINLPYPGWVDGELRRMG